MTQRDVMPELDGVLERLAEGKRVRRELGEWGRIYLDRVLPFLCVYRTPAAGSDPGMRDLVTGEASYLVASGRKRDYQALATVVRGVADYAAAEFGGFLVIELWSVAAGADEGADGEATFRVVTERFSPIIDTADQLEARLARIRGPALPRLGAETRERQRVAAPGMQPLLRAGDGYERELHTIGLGVPSVYVNSETGELYPIIHRQLRRALSGALKRTVFHFTRAHTEHQPRRYQALGSRSLTKGVWDVDRKLAEVSGQFDFLLLTTPRNIHEAWNEFRRARYERAPRFSYRPSPIDISLAKRELYGIRVERIEDPSLSELFREQQDVLDRKLTMIGDRETGRFRLESLQLFGGAETELVRQAEEILASTPSRAREAVGGPDLGAEAFAGRAEAAIAELRARDERVQASVEIRRDISGLMVSQGNLLVGRALKIPASRVDALIQHEIGTHVLTYYNGAAQPLKQLRSGLPAYEELQEGLAVMAEFLIGGLSRPRLRLLAARVVAIARMLDGASFVEVFRELDGELGFPRRAAFTATARVFRGGGHTKDSVYLRGFLRLFDYLREGHPIEPLYVGKISLQHLAIIEELRIRNVLAETPQTPRFLERADVRERLERLRVATTLLDMVRDEAKRGRRA